MLRDYQQSAHDAAIAWVRSYVEPCLIDAATGAGKSHIIAAIANTVHRISGGKHILCLAPSAELVTQNHEKYKLTGNPASIFSASAGRKCLRHPVVFGTPGTVKNRISRFGQEFALVIIDEAHGITPTIKTIIDAIRLQNPNVRVIGLSATPYRLKTGYIFATDEDGKPVESIEPYFARRICRITAQELIDQGYLTPPVIGAINAESYDTSGLVPNARGQFDADAIDRAYNGHGRKTAAVIADIVNQSRNRKGVIIFAATVQHAHECMASLPPELSAIVTADTSAAERRSIVRKFKAQKLKYLVNVGVFTTGFDADHVDVIALLRMTESVALLQQMIGRGLRIREGKINCLVLDYVDAIDRHCPDGDLFNPEIKTSFLKIDDGSQLIKAVCPGCSTENEFGARPNPDQYEINESGYFVDLDGNEIKTEFGSIPAHFGRRCQALLPARGGRLEQCSYRWTFKECPNCGADNDIAARYCSSCKAEIVDPNEKLKIEFRKLKRDPTRIQCDRLLTMTHNQTMSRSGNEVIRVDFVTDIRSFSVWLNPESKWPKLKVQHAIWVNETNNGQLQPATVTYSKDKASGFYSIHAFNQPEDEC